MNNLLIMYLIYLSWGTAGQGRVSFLEMSRYLRCSKTHCRKMMLDMQVGGMIEIIQTRSDKGSIKLFAQLSHNGQDFLMANFDAAIDTYHQYVALTIQAIKERQNNDDAPRKVSRKEVEAIAAGQKAMFDYE